LASNHLAKEGACQKDPNGDGSGGIKKLHVFVGARIPGSQPNLSRLLPLEPWPTKPKSCRKFFKIKDAKAPIFFWTTHGFPIDLRFSTGGGVFVRPNKGAFMESDSSKLGEQQVAVVRDDDS
jgi:hypothetical protein